MVSALRVLFIKSLLRISWTSPARFLSLLSQRVKIQSGNSTATWAAIKMVGPGIIPIPLSWFSDHAKLCFRSYFLGFFSRYYRCNLTVNIFYLPAQGDHNHKKIHSKFTHSIKGEPKNLIVCKVKDFADTIWDRTLDHTRYRYTWYVALYNLWSWN